MMSMKVNYTTMTKVGQAECVTEHARYGVEFTLADDLLQTVRVTVYGVDDEQTGVMMGVLEYSQEHVSAYNFPYSDKYPQYVSDFMSIVEDVKSNVVSPLASGASASEKSEESGSASGSVSKKVPSK